MKARTLTGTIEVEKLLEGYMSKTKQWSYLGEMTNIFVNKVTGNEPIDLPTVITFTDRVEAYRKEMINLYNGTLGLYDGVVHVPDDIKIAQAAVLDGVCYGYDLNKGVNNLYTMRVDLFGDELEGKDLDKVLEANLRGEIKALKLSYEYRNNDNKIIDYKLGAHRTVIDDEESCVLVPLIAGVSLLEILKRFMNQGLVVKVVQDLSNGPKVRCVTEKLEVLRNYCDSQAAVHGLKSIYYPLDAFFYAPVIGAPSTTAMMTSINLFNISELRRIQNNKQLSELGVQKPIDPISVDLSEQIITEYILRVAEDESTAEFENFIERLPKREVLGDVDRGISDRVVSRYLHTMKRADIKEILKLIPAGASKLERLRGLYSEESRLATEEEMQNPYILFKNNICKVLIKKKDGTFSSITCTNNKDMLVGIYGKNYFAVYESFGVRARGVQSYIDEHDDSIESIESALDLCGFDCAAGVLKDVAGNFNEDGYYHGLFDIYDVTKKESSSGDSILVRTTNARFSKVKGKAENYYNSIDMNKVQRILVLG